jgi:Fur family ferric uptake transcriptional regulator
VTIGTTSSRDALRGAGLRVTLPRGAVLDSVRADPHADVESLTRAARDRLGSVSVQAVYDVLRVLSEARLIRRVEPAGSPARYEIERGDNHHHLTCRTCGVLVDVPCATGEPPCVQPPSVHGFTLHEAEIIYWGQCPACQNNTAQTTTRGEMT